MQCELRYKNLAGYDYFFTAYSSLNNYCLARYDLKKKTSVIVILATYDKICVSLLSILPYAVVSIMFGEER